MNKRIRYSPLTIFVSAIAASSLLVFGVWLHTSSGISQNDPQRALDSAVEKLVQAEDGLEITSEVSSGNWPWDVVRTTHLNVSGSEQLAVSNYQTRLVWEHSPEKDTLSIYAVTDNHFQVAPKLAPLLNDLEQALQTGGFITDLQQLTDLTVINAVAMEQQEGRILRHFQIKPKSPAQLTALITLIEKTGLDPAGLKTPEFYNYEIVPLSTDVWIDDSTGQITSIKRTFSWGENHFAITTTFGYGVQLDDISSMTFQLLEDMQSQLILDGRSQLPSFGFIRLADQLADAALENLALSIQQSITDFAKEQLFYPSIQQYSQLISAVDQSSDLMAQISYQPEPAGCDNQAQNYCASYKLLLDARYNGLSGTILPQVDITFTP